MACGPSILGWATSTVPQLDLVDQVQREMQLTPEQACIILEYMALHGNKYASNYPTLSYRLARTLAGYLPTVRPDLERLVKDTTYKTDQPTKEILLDALRGEQTGLVRKAAAALPLEVFCPEDKPEMWEPWRFFARVELGRVMPTSAARFWRRSTATPPIGRAAPRSAQVPDWGASTGNSITSMRSAMPSASPGPSRVARMFRRRWRICGG